MADLQDLIVNQILVEGQNVLLENSVMGESAVHSGVDLTSSSPISHLPTVTGLICSVRTVCPLRWAHERVSPQKAQGTQTFQEIATGAASAPHERESLKA